MQIDIVVPACTTKRDYLHHPDCDATKVRELFLKGLCINDIARSLGVSRFKVGKVLEFLEMEPKSNPNRIDYLHHPRCEALRAMELRQQGWTFDEIGEHFGVSQLIVSRVLWALCKRDEIPMPPAKPTKWRTRHKEALNK